MSLPFFKKCVPFIKNIKNGNQVFNLIFSHYHMLIWFEVVIITLYSQILNSLMFLILGYLQQHSDKGKSSWKIKVSPRFLN